MTIGTSSISNKNKLALMMIPRIFISGWKFVVVMFVVFFTLEVCTRIDDAIKYGAPLVGDYSANDLRSKDSDGLPYNLPNARFEKWQHNSLGFRGPEITQNKFSGTVRVVCMGSSESYGLYESPRKEWPSQLQEQLSTPKFEIVNASVVGLNLPSYDAYLKKHVFPLNPDIIILVISPLMYVSSLENLAMKRSSPPKTVGKSESEDASLTKILGKKIRVIPKIKLIIKQLAANNLPDMLKKYQLWSTEKEIREIERLRLNGRKPKDSVPEIDIEKFEKELSRIVESIRSQGIEVMLTSYPTLMSHYNIFQYKEIFLDNRRFSIYLSLNGMVDSVNKLNAVIRHIAKEHKTMFFDTASILPKSTDYFSDNVHYTDNGAKRIAEGIAKKLLYKKYATIPVHNYFPN